MSDSVKIQTNIRFQFEVTVREWALIINALKKAGGQGIALAGELESKRSEHFKEIERRFATWLDTNEGRNE